MSLFGFILCCGEVIKACVVWEMVLVLWISSGQLTFIIICLLTVRSAVERRGLEYEIFAT